MKNKNGTAYFLVYDENLPEVCSSGDPFVEWLTSEGFKRHELYHGSWRTVTVLYVNLNNKTIALGMPGIKLFDPIGNHAITIEEFKAIYEIYKKYEGKQVLEF